MLIDINVSINLNTIIGFVVITMIGIIGYFITRFIQTDDKFKANTYKSREETTANLNLIINNVAGLKRDLVNHEKSDEDFHEQTNENLSVIKERLNIIG